jgi:uncharacterized protein (DUF885 family)
MTQNTSMSRRSILLGTAAFATFGVTSTSSRAAKTPVASLDAGLLAVLKLMPESCVYAGLTEAQVGAPILNRFDDYSPTGESGNRAALARALKSARNAGSGNAAKIAQATYRNALRINDVSYGRVLPLGFLGHTPFVVSQIGGAAIDPLNLMAAQQPVTSASEAKAYVEKIGDFTRMFDGAIEKIRFDAAQGLNLPLALMKKTLAYLDEAMKIPAASHEIIASLGSKLKAAGYSETDRAQVQLSATQKLETNLYPSLIKLREALASLAPNARNQDGFWAQPQGERFYANAVRTLGDTTRMPAQVHQLGLDEVARITAEMDAGLRKLGYATGSVGTRMKALAVEPANMYADSDVGRNALLENLRAQVAAINLKMPAFLNATTIPPQQVEVRRVPVATEASAPGGYYDSPSLDGTRPGIYWINLRDMKAVSKLRLATLTFHEAVPGHHLANAIALNQPGQPLVQKLASFNAFNEGWALYAERLAFELGFYENDPTGNLGRLQDELFRAVRLVVDSGLHFKRWSREKAIAYAMDATGNVRSRMEAEIERYMAWPGQALGYKLGMIELLSLRDQLKKRQGDSYSVKNFHDTVLINGSRPLSLVAADIAKI